MATEYRLERAGRIDRWTGTLPPPPPIIGLRIAVGARRKGEEIELTEDEALGAAADLIAAVLEARKNAARKAARGVTA